MTKRPEGFEYGLTNEKWTVYGQEIWVDQLNQTTTGTRTSGTSSVNLPALVKVRDLS